MTLEVSLTPDALRGETLAAACGKGLAGSWVEFTGLVRREEAGQPIAALEYEAYPGMAEAQMERILTELGQQYPCLSARVIHRVGLIPVGEAAIYVGIASVHRQEGFALLAEFMNRLKQDVPIWKVRAIPSSQRAD